MHTMVRRVLIALAALIACLMVSYPLPALAGCGCDKPPPPLASIRPAFASPGDVVTLFAPGIEEGRPYTAIFTKQGATALASGVATIKRDFADGAMKPQLSIAVPDLPPGPIQVWVVAPDSTIVLDVPTSDFTVLQKALALPEANAVTMAKCYQAARVECCPRAPLGYPRRWRRAGASLSAPCSTVTASSAAR